MTPNQQISYKAGVTADIQITREENLQTRHQGFHTEKVHGTSHLLQGSMGSHCSCQNIPKSQQALENVPGSCLFPQNTLFNTIQPPVWFFLFMATSLLASGFCICHLFRCHPPKFPTSGAHQSLDVLLTQMSPLQRNFLILSSQLVFTPSPRHTHILYGSPSASLSGFIFLLKVITF